MITLINLITASNSYIVEFNDFFKSLNINNYEFKIPQEKPIFNELNTLFYFNLLNYKLKEDINEISSILIPLFEIKSEISINALNCNNIQISKEGNFIFNELFLLKNIIKSSYLIYGKDNLYELEKINKTVSTFIYNEPKTNKIVFYILISLDKTIIIYDKENYLIFFKDLINGDIKKFEKLHIEFNLTFLRKLKFPQNGDILLIKNKEIHEKYNLQFPDFNDTIYSDIEYQTLNIEIKPEGKVLNIRKTYFTYHGLVGFPTHVNESCKIIRLYEENLTNSESIKKTCIIS